MCFVNIKTMEILKRKDVSVFVVVSGLVLLLMSIFNTINGFNGDLIFHKVSGILCMMLFSVTSFINIREFRKNHLNS